MNIIDKTLSKYKVIISLMFVVYIPYSAILACDPTGRNKVFATINFESLLPISPLLVSIDLFEISNNYNLNIHFIKEINFTNNSNHKYIDLTYIPATAFFISMFQYFLNYKNNKSDNVLLLRLHAPKPILIISGNFTQNNTLEAIVFFLSFPAQARVCLYDKEKINYIDETKSSLSASIAFKFPIFSLNHLRMWKDSYLIYEYGKKGVLHE